MGIVQNCKGVIVVLQVLSALGIFMYAKAFICEVGREKDEFGTWRWVLPHGDPCGCHKIVMGGVNTRTPIRPFKPTYVDRPLISEDINAIRAHYGLVCKATWGTTWGNWSDCSTTCDNGTQYRQLECNMYNYVTSYCDGEQPEERRHCNAGKCPFWSDWNPWGNCEYNDVLYCGIGTRYRYRVCDNSSFPDVPCPANQPVEHECCEKVWDTFNGYSYFLVKETKSYFKARDACIEQNAVLTSILSQEEQDFIENFLQNFNANKAIWIGFNDKQEELKWTWEDGTKYYYMNWENGEPNNKNDAQDCCVLQQSNRRWDDQSCRNKHMYICKIGLLQATVSECTTGWPIQNRDEIDRASDYTTVSPDMKFTCDGQVTEWRFQAKASHKLTAIVLRPITGYKPKFEVVGFNDIPAAEIEINKPILYIVPENDRISVKAGDVIGWSVNQAVLNWNDDPNTEIRYKLDIIVSSSGNVVDFQFSYTRAYSIQATVKTFGEWRTFNSYSYFLVKETKTYDEARDACMEQNAVLTSIASQEEQEFLVNFLEGNEDQRVWIGLNDIQEEGNWTWEDGTQFSYRHWGLHQPGDHGHRIENCVGLEIQDNTRWHDFECTLDFWYICKIGIARQVGYPLGMANGSISDEQITASSTHQGSGHGAYAPWKGRLNFPDGHWAPLDDPSPWIQVKFSSEVKMTALQTQGSGGGPGTQTHGAGGGSGTEPLFGWVEEMLVSTGDSVGSISSIVHRRSANTDRTSIATIVFPRAVCARIVRIEPKDCMHFCALRFEVFGYQQC